MRLNLARETDFGCARSAKIINALACQGLDKKCVVGRNEGSDSPEDFPEGRPSQVESSG